MPAKDIILNVIPTLAPAIAIGLIVALVVGTLTIEFAGASPLSVETETSPRVVFGC